eukprot:gene6398-7169_t
MVADFVDKALLALRSMVADFVPAGNRATLMLYPFETVVARHREWQAEFAEGIAQIWAWCRALATAPLIGLDATHIGDDNGIRGTSFGGGTGPVCWCLGHCADCGGWVAGGMLPARARPVRGPCGLSAARANYGSSLRGALTVLRRRFVDKAPLALRSMVADFVDKAPLALRSMVADFVPAGNR